MSDLELRRRADAILSQILDLPREEWATALDRLCPRPPELRRLLERLLEGAAEDGGLGDALGSAVRGRLEDALDASAGGLSGGTIVGPFRIEEEIGRGGMGIVYRARRIETFDQVVALKVLTVAADDRLRRRFQTERAMLARLEHPNIARLIDGGVTDDGVLYFAMEYVEGRRLDEYLDADSGVRARIDLFLQVARAVEFAHRQLLVHCDIKPANVLVDGDGRARLLDFGIGRVLEEQDGAATQTRGFLTPQYASPEQVLGQPVTPASDIYQLGLLLYEMLSGTRPYAVAGKTPAEVQQAICVDEPSRPSRAAQTGDAGAPPPAVVHRLRGELDTIVMTALHKDPDRRYPSVSALIADLEAYLSNRPISARSLTAAYRMRKFVRRNRVLTGAAVVVLALAIVYVVTVSLQRQRIVEERDAAQRESQRAEQALGIMFDVFVSNNPHEGNPAEVTARQLLDRAAARIDQDDSLAADVKADLTSALARVYNGLWLPEKSEELAWQSVELHREAYGPEDPRLVEILLVAGTNAARGGDFERSETALREVLAIADRAAVDPELVNNARFYLSRTLARQRKYDEAEATLQRWFDSLPADAEEKISGTGHTMFGNILSDAGRFNDALPYFEEALRRREAYHGADSLSAANARAHVAETRIRTGDVERGLVEAETALQQIFDKMGTRTVDYGSTKQRLAAGLLNAGELELAGTMARESLEALAGLDGNPALIGFNHFILAEVALARNDVAAARQHAAQARDNTASDGGTQRARALELIAKIETAAGRPTEARAALLEAREIYAAIPSQSHRLAAIDEALERLQ